MEALKLQRMSFTDKDRTAQSLSAWLASPESDNFVYLPDAK
jgi:hypothetical protein